MGDGRHRSNEIVGHVEGGKEREVLQLLNKKGRRERGREEGREGGT